MKSTGRKRWMFAAALCAAALHGEVQADWENLGGGLEGEFGLPALIGTGTLLVADPTTILVAFAPADAATVLFISLASVPIPFKGGVLEAFPPTTMVPFAADALGTVTLAFPWPAGIPAGTSFWFQFAIDDPDAVEDVSLSNTVMATT